MQHFGKARRRSAKFAALVAVLGCGTVVPALTASASTAHRTAPQAAATSPGVDVATHTITIGATTSETGVSSEYFENGEGRTAAIDLANAQGGVNGWKIKFIQEDDQSTPTVAVPQAITLMTTDHIFADLGTGGTNTEPTAVEPLAIKYHVPMIGIIGDAGVLQTTYPTALGLISASPAAGLWTAFTIQAMHAKGENNVAFAYIQGAFGQATNVAAQYVATEDHMTYKSLPVSPTATDFSGYAASLQATHATSVFIGLPSPQVDGIIESANAIGYHPQWVSWWSSVGSSVFQPLGKLANNMQFEDFLEPVTANNAGMHTFINAMKKYTADKTPSTTAEEGWLGAEEFLYGLKEITANGAIPTQTALVNALNNGKPFTPGGLTTTYTFSKSSRVPIVKDSFYQYNSKTGALSLIYGPAAEPTIPAKDVV